MDRLILFFTAMKNCVFIFEKKLIVYQKLDLLSKRIKIWKGYVTTQQSLCFSLKFCACAFFSNAYEKVLRNSYFFLSRQIFRKQNKNKNPSTGFRHRYAQHKLKISGKIINPILVGAPGRFCFLNKIMVFGNEEVCQKSLTSIFQGIADMILTNLQKAFDTINHKILLKKLGSMAIN